MPLDCVIGKLANLVHLAPCGKELEGANPKMRRRNTRQHCAFFGAALAQHLLARQRGGEGAGRGNTQRMHGLTEQIFAQHRTQHCFAVTPARKRCGARPFQMNVAPLARAVDNLAQKERATIPQLRREPAELMPCIGHSQGCCARRRGTSGQDGCHFGRVRRFSLKTQFHRQLSIPTQECGRGCPIAHPRDIKPLEITGIAVLKR